MDDKMTKDIRNKIKKMASDSAKYTTNVGKSMAYSSKFVAKLKMPNLTNFIDVNKDLIGDILNTLKNPKALSSELESISNSSVMKELRELRDNAIADLKTGKFYDETRDRTEFGKQTQELLSSFGGVDLDFSDDGEYIDNTDTDKDGLNLKIAQIQEDNADDRTRLTISSIGESTDAIVSNQRAIHSDDIKVKLKQHSQMMSGMGNIITMNAAMFESQNTTMTNLTNTLKETNTHIVNNLNNIANILTEIRDNTKTAPSNVDRPYEEQDMPFKNGALDIKKYIKHVLGNVDTKYGISSNISMAMMGMSASEFIALYKSNPLQFITDRLVLAMVPDVTKKVSESFDRSIGGFFSALLLKFNSMSEKSELAKIFGIDIRSKRNIDPSRYNTGDIKFSGRAEKAIVEVIPAYLAEIAEAVTGRGKKVYNYDKGEFVDPYRAIEEYQKRVNDVVGHMSRTMAAIDEKLKDVEFATDDQKEVFQKDLYKYFQTMAERQHLVNPYTKYDDLGIVLEGGKSSYAMIQGLTRSLGRSGLMDINREIISGLMDRDAQNQNINRELQKSGLITLFNNFDDRFNKASEEVKSGNVLNKETLKNIFDQSNESFGAAKALTDIRNILTKGIITYSYNMGPVSGDKVSRIIESINKDATALYDKSERSKLLLTNSKIAKAKYDQKSELEAANESIGGNKKLFSTKLDLSSDDWTSFFEFKEGERIAANKKKDDELRKNGFLYKILQEKSFTRRAAMVAEGFKSIMQAPFIPLTKAMRHIDKKMYQIIYGSDNDSEDFNEGAVNKLTELVKFNINTFRDWLDNKILIPLDNRLFGKDGIITKLSERFSPYKDKVKDKLSGFRNKMSNYLLGDKEEYVDPETGETTTIRSGGILSKYTNEFDKQKNKVFKEIKGYGTNILDSMKLMIFGGDPETIYDDDGFVTIKEHKGLFNGFKDLFKSAKISFARFFFGDDEEYLDPETGEIIVNETESKKLWGDVSKEFKGFLPKGIAGATIGAVGTGAFGVLTSLFLPGGPILGALIGATTAFVNHSDRFKKYLFGDEEKEGVIDKEIVDGFKKFAPKTAAGFGIGALITNFGILGTSIIPGGPIVGGLLGSIVGMTAASDQMKELLFGNTLDPKSGLISKEFRDKVKDSLPVGITGGLGGFAIGTLMSNYGILGMQFLPGGPILGALAGIGAALNADVIKRFLFGGEDKEGKSYKGIFKGFFDFSKDKLFKPFIDGINNTGKSIKNWFQESIVDQLKESMSPLKREFEESREKIKEALGNFGTYIKDSISSVFEKHFGAPLGELVEKHITGPIKNAMGQILRLVGSVIGGILSLPFRAINSYAKDLDRKHKAQDRAESGKNAINNFLKGVFKGNSEDGTNGFFSWVVNLKEKSESIRESMSNNVSTFLTNMGLGFLITKDNAIEKAKTIKDSMKSKINDVGVGVSITKDNVKTKLNSIRDRLGRGEPVSDEEIAELEKVEQQTTTPGKPTRTRKGIRDIIDEWKTDYKARRERRESKDQVTTTATDSSTSEKSIYDNVDERKDSKVKGNSSFKLLKSVADSSKTIKDEIKGQLDGVGYNLEYIRNILMDQFGPPDILPGVMKGLRGNRKRRGVLGKIYDAISYPFQLIGEKIGEGFGFAKEKGKKAIGFILSPFRLLGSAINGIVTGARHLGDALGNLLPIIGDLASIFTTFIKEGLKLGIEVLSTGIQVGVKAIGDSIGAFTGFISGLTRSVGESVGNMLNMITSAGSAAVSALGSLATTIFDITKIIIPELFAGLLGIGKFVGKGIYKGAKWTGKHVLGKMLPKSVTQTIVGEEHYISGGTIDVVKRVDDVRFRDANGITSSSLSLVSMVGGKLASLPSKAIPVYVLGGNINSKVRNSVSDNIFGDTQDIEVLENKIPIDSKKSEFNVFKEFRRKYSEIYQKMRTESSDKTKIFNTKLSNIASESERSALEQTALVQIADSTRKTGSFLQKLTDGDKKKPGLLELIPSLLGPLGKVFSILGPLLGSAVSLASGDNMDRVAINVMKMIPGLSGKNGILNKGLKSAGKFVADKGSSLFGWAKNKLGLNLGKAAGEVAEESIDDILNGSFKTLADGTITIGTKSIGEEVGQKGIKSLIPRIIQSIKNLMSNSKIVKAVGGRKVLTRISSFFDDFAKALAPKITSSKLASKILAKCTPINIAFMLYDISTGMAEAANIFKINSNRVTFKMRVTAGLSKMLSGLVFGILTDRFIASILFRFIGDENDEDNLENAQDAFGQEVDEYNREHGTTLDINQYSDKVANKRVWRRAWDGMKSAWSSGGKALSKVNDFAGAFNVYSRVKTLFDKEKASSMFGVSQKEVTFGQQYSAMMADSLSRITFGLVDPNGVAQKIYGIIKTMGDTITNIADGVKAIAAGVANFIGDKIKNVSGFFKNFFKKSSNTDLDSVLGKSYGNLYYGRGHAMVEEGHSTLPPRLNGMYHFYQKDPLWSSDKSLDIGNSGCGPVSAAMVLSSYAGSQVSPVETARYALDGGFKGKDGGTNPTFFQSIGLKYGVDMNRGKIDKKAMVENLKNNKPLILMGKNKVKNSRTAVTTPFRDSMHYLVANGIDDKGYVTVYDPLRRSPSKYRLTTIMKDINAAIYTSKNGYGVKSSIDLSHRKGEQTEKNDTGSDPSGIALSDTAIDMQTFNNMSSDYGNNSGFQASDEKLDLFGLLDNIRSVMGGLVDVKYGFKSYDDLKNEHLGTIDDMIMESEGGRDDGSTDIPLASKTGKPYGKRPGSLLKPSYLENLYVHDWFGERLEKLAKHYKKQLELTSGYRSIEKQKQLWNKRKSQHPGEPDSVTTKWVARPGKSRHNAGLAMDVAGWAKSLSNDELNKFGLYKPLNWEDWHIEPTETKGLNTAQLIEKWGVPQLAGMNEGYGRGGSMAVPGIGNGLINTVKDFNKNYGAGELLSSIKNINKSINNEFKRADDDRKISKLSQQVDSMATESLDKGFGMMAAVMSEMLKVLKDIRDNTSDTNDKPVAMPPQPIKKDTTPIARASKDNQTTDMMSVGARIIDKLTSK